MNNQTNFKLDSAKRDRSKMETLLREKDGSINFSKNKIRCPFHDDKTASASLKAAESGIYYFKCFVCDITYDLISLQAEVEGKEIGDVLKGYKDDSTNTGNKNMNENSQPEKTFQTYEAAVASFKGNYQIEEENRYFATNGTFDFVTLRLIKDGKKTFFPLSKGKDDLWRLKNPLVGKLPLFNRVTINKSDTVIVVEGEKCVRAIQALQIPNLAATTSPSGANSADKADWSPLKDKNVSIWRDNDAAGLNYQNAVIGQIEDIAKSIKIVNIGDLGLKEKEDAVDYIATLHAANAEDKRKLFQLAYENSTGSDGKIAIETHFEDIYAGRYKCLKFPKAPILSSISKALIPGSVTCICGDPNAGKSFFLIENVWRWLADGLKVKILMLEDVESMHQKRALSQMAGCAKITDSDWIAAAKEESSRVLKANIDNLRKFAKALKCTESTTATDAATSQMTLDQVADWVITQAQNGAEIIVIDPITAATAVGNPWIADQLFLFKVKKVLQETGARLILSTHPRTGTAGSAGLSGMAGGASYPRFSHTVLWIKHLNGQKNTQVADQFGKKQSRKYSQSLEIIKARNGKGRGQNLACELDKQSLCFTEIGLIETTEKQAFLFESYLKPGEIFEEKKEEKKTKSKISEKEAEALETFEKDLPPININIEPEPEIISEKPTQQKQWNLPDNENPFLNQMLSTADRSASGAFG